MIPKEVTNAVSTLESGDAYQWASKECIKIIKNYLETSDRYMRDLEQHVDDLVAGQHGMDDD